MVFPIIGIVLFVILVVYLLIKASQDQEEEHSVTESSSSQDESTNGVSKTRVTYSELDNPDSEIFKKQPVDVTEPGRIHSLTILGKADSKTGRSDFNGLVVFIHPITDEFYPGDRFRARITEVGNKAAQAVPLEKLS